MASSATSSITQLQDPLQLTACDKQKLQFIGSIQNTGFIIVIHYETMKIVAYSANIVSQELLNRAPNIDEKLQNIFEDSSFVDQKLRNLIHEMKQDNMQRTFTTVTLKDREFTVSICSAGLDLFLLEFELDSDSNRSNRNELAQQLTEIGRMLQEKLPDDDDSTDTETLALNTARKACDTVMQMANKFERGMVYRFADDLSGEVHHEIKREGIPTSYAGMRFPSADIPLSARKLYITNGLRYINNVNDPAIEIISKSGTKIDLSHCRMRAVAVPHIAYLQNMGVKSSMSVAIVVEGNLWGLLAFHGYSQPYCPGLHQRIAFETVSRMVSIRIESLFKREKSGRLVELSKLLNRVPSELPIEFLCRNHYDICSILKADAIAFKNGLNEYFFGEDKSLQPDDSFWDVMNKYPNDSELLIASTRLQVEQIGITDPCKASGMIYFEHGNFQFVALRSVRMKDVCWGGTPDEAKLKIGDILHPRKSFEAYMQKARQESISWSKSDTEIATAFKDRLVERIRSEALNVLNYDLETSNERCVEAIRLAAQNYEFFAQMSHELRTPFHGVMACLEILQKTGDDPIERNEAISIALRCGHSMMSVLNDILNVAKNKHGLELNLVDFMPNESINRVTEVMRAFAESGKKKLIVNINNDRMVDQLCYADKIKFEQITSNLINNAIKFTQETGTISTFFDIVDSLEGVEKCWSERKFKYFCSTKVVVHDAVPGDDERAWLCAFVEDTGCGIPSADIETVFQPYMQSAKSVSKTHAGTGLGLHICAEHVRKMSGLFRCASAEGKGSMFFFSIPVSRKQVHKEENETEADDTEKNDEIEENLALQNAEGHVLVVDDNKVNLKLACRKITLIAPKLTVHSAANGKLGAEKYIELVEEGKHPKLILMDYHMPVMSGLESVKVIRAWEQSNNAQAAWIASFTADLSENSKSELIDAGANSVLPKPCPPGELERMTKNVFLSDFV